MAILLVHLRLWRRCVWMMRCYGVSVVHLLRLMSLGEHLSMHHTGTRRSMRRVSHCAEIDHARRSNGLRLLMLLLGLRDL
jgi:hypothetical protein